MKTPDTQKPKVLDVAFIANCREGWCFALPSWRQAYSTPSNLARCAPPEAFLALRASLAAFWLGITIWSMAEHKSNDWETAPEWYIYLTHWTLLFELFYLILATVANATSRLAHGSPGVPADKTLGKGDAGGEPPAAMVLLSPWVASVPPCGAL